MQYDLSELKKGTLKKYIYNILIKLIIKLYTG